MLAPEHKFNVRVAYARDGNGYLARVKVTRTDLGPKPIPCGLHVAWEESASDAVESALDRAGETLRACEYDSRQGVIFRAVATVERVGKVTKTDLNAWHF
jgi:hypothetical protein